MHPQAAKSIGDFFNANNFCFYRNYCLNSRSPDETRSNVLHDRNCSLCRNEMHRLQARDQHRRLTLVDISATRFDAGFWGFSPADLSAALHLQRPDGTWLIGMAAILHGYTRVGLDWLMAPSGWPLLTTPSDRLNTRLAGNRQTLSRWLGMQTGTRCNNALGDSGLGAAATELETHRHD
jgi:predicted DCC family thiol-disulfide oxidoreductase YuxK